MEPNSFVDSILEVVEANAIIITITIMIIIILILVIIFEVVEANTKDLVIFSSFNADICSM